MKNATIRAPFVILLAMVFLLAASTFLSAQEGQQESRKEGAAEFILMQDLIGYQVVDGNGEVLGDLQDLVITLDGSVPYLLVRFTPFIYDYQFGQQLHLVPFEMADLNPGQEQVRLARLEAEQLSAAPPVNRDEMLNPRQEWDLAFRDWWLAEPRYNYDVQIDPGPGTSEQDLKELAARTEAGRIMLASVLDGYDILDAKGDDAGDVEGVMLNTQSGRVEYLGLSSGSGFLGLGEQIYPIPLERLSIDVEEDEVRISVTESTMENAPGFDDEKAWAETPASEWTAKVKEFWSGR